MDESPTPRRALPPVPPPARPSATTVLAPPADETTWFDALDPMVDSMRLGPLDDGTAAGAARDLIRDSARQPVLDQALLEALDAAAKAAAARRAVTIDVPAPPTGSLPAAAVAAAVAAAPPAPARPAVPAPAAVPVVPVATSEPVGPVTVAAPVADLDDADDLEDDLADELDDDRDEDDAPPPAPGLRTAHAASLRIAPQPVAEPVTEVDVAAEFARHDDFLETGRHAVDQEWMSDTGRHHVITDTGRHYAVDVGPEDDEAGPLTHRTVITRSSSARRWIPAGIGAGVLSIVAAVLLTSGFASDGAPTGTDEAARTGEAGTEAPATTTPAPTMPGMGTIDLSGTVAPSTADPAQPDLADARPQVATPPSTARAGSQAVVPGSGAGSGAGTGSGTGTGAGSGSGSGTGTGTSGGGSTGNGSTTGGTTTGGTTTGGTGSTTPTTAVEPTATVEPGPPPSTDPVTDGPTSTP